MKNNKYSEYRNTSTGNSNSKILSVLKNHLKLNSKLLQLGIGSGKDLELLSDLYKITGSDFSKLVLSLYQQLNPNADLLLLDPIELKTERKFDAIYSNKVLHQVDSSDLKLSLMNQLNLLNDNGIALHTFWSGNQTEDHHGLKWVYYTEDRLSKLIPEGFRILEMNTYIERFEHDSLYLLLEKV
jgi:trans-aconitate methyltransferase